jgi:transcriptional regulator with XRE-family HTH domain
MNKLSTPEMIVNQENIGLYDCGKYITDSDSTILSMTNRQKERGSLSVMGDRLRRLREGLGMSQSELGEAVKKMVGEKGTQSHISNLEKSTGDKLPSVPTLRALAVILETNTDYLLGLTDDDRPHGQMDDQVVATIEDAEERRMVQETVDLMAQARKDEKEYIAALVRRLIPKPPRIIGSE